MAEKVVGNKGERGPCVGHEENRRILRQFYAFLHDKNAASAFIRLLREVVSVSRRAAKADENSAFVCLSRVIDDVLYVNAFYIAVYELIFNVFK